MKDYKGKQEEDYGGKLLNLDVVHLGREEGRNFFLLVSCFFLLNS